MAEEGTPIAETPKKVARASKAKKPKPAASHPKISVMVNDAIQNLKERGGSSLQAIKKYIGSNYKVDVERLAPFVKKYLKSAVATGELVQTKGKGASGSFKLKGKAEANPKAVKTAKKSKPASPAKKAAKPAKKTSVKKVTKKPKAEKKSKSAKSPKKPKVKAAAATKPKPKPKKAARAAPKKAAAKKGRK